MAGNGIPYFPLACTLDDKLRGLRAEFGIKAVGVFVLLLQRIYGEEGYYVDWNEEVALLFSAEECQMGDNAVSEIVSACIRRGLFDKAMYDRYGILTSRGIQTRWFAAVERRRSLKVVEEYLLLPVPTKLRDVCIFSKIVDNSSKNVCNFKQRKGEKEEEEEKTASTQHDYLRQEYMTAFGVYPRPAQLEALEEIRRSCTIEQELLGRLIRMAAINATSAPVSYITTIARDLSKRGIRTVQALDKAMGDAATGKQRKRDDASDKQRRTAQPTRSAGRQKQQHDYMQNTYTQDFFDSLGVDLLDEK